MPIVNLDGNRIYYDIQGMGFPLVLIHHLAGNTKSWRNQIPYFSKKFRVITYDLRGHGRSDDPKKAFTMQDLADDLYLLLSKLDIERCAIIGHSIGGVIAPLFASKHKTMVSALVIVAGAGKALSAEKMVVYGKFREIASTQGMEALAEYRKSENQIPKRIANDYALWAFFKQLYAETSVQGYVRASEALDTMTDIIDELKHLDFPAIGIVGDLDPVFMETMNTLAENAGVTLHVMRRCGHFMMIEAPDEFNATVSRFLNSYTLK